ncbi:MAG TPA: pitrilysin family protein [Polyangiaceae bacterium]|jgi:zinc protease
MSMHDEPRVRALAELNETAKAPNARWAFDGLHVFGQAGGGEGGAAPVARYRLGNGLTLLFLEDPSAPVVSYFTWFAVGSRHERPGKTGLAHLFEHLMFNETETLKAGEFDRLLEENGAESNAATWVDWTYYYESLPADRFPLAVRLESERMGRLILRDAQVSSEKEVVANERRYRVDDDVEGTANEVLYKTAFSKHPYHWPTIGWMPDILGFTPEDCERFYKTYYAPNNAILVVVGDVREADVLREVRDHYGKLGASIIPPEDCEPEPPQKDVREVEIKKPTATEKLLVGYHGPALGDAEHAAMTILTEILFGGRASRAHRALVIEKEIASDVRGWVATFKDPGLFELYATAREGHDARELLHALDRELERVRRDVVTEDELTRAKARLELSTLQSLESTSGKAEQIGFYELVLGDPGAVFRRLEAYRRVTASDVRKAARRYITPHARTIVRVVPGDDEDDEEVDAEEAAE